jgi:hypothetical protein
LWHEIYSSFKQHHYRNFEGDVEFVQPRERIFYAMHVDREYLMADDFRNDFAVLVGKMKKTIMHGDYIQVFGWIQYALRSGPPTNFAKRIQLALISGRAAYACLMATLLLRSHRKPKLKQYSGPSRTCPRPSSMARAGTCATLLRD